MRSLPANAQLDRILGGLGNRGNQGDSRTASGLKEALQIGTDHAVDLTGTTDGFFKNEAIKILLPEKLRSVEKGLRMAGMGTKIAPAARGIFKDALMQMTFEDARKILTGGNTLGHGVLQRKDFRRTRGRVQTHSGVNDGRHRRRDPI